MSKELHLHLFKIPMIMPVVVTMIMAVTVTAVMDFTIPSCSSITGGRGISVEMWCSSVVWCWTAVSILKTGEISFSAIKAI